MRYTKRKEVKVEHQWRNIHVVYHYNIYIMKTQYFIGIDLHKEFAFWTVKDVAGTIVAQTKLAVQEEETKQAAKRFSSLAETKAVLEPVCAWQLYRQWLIEENVNAAVVAPLKVKAMAWNRLKNDRVDSELLAELLRLGFVPEITPPDSAQEKLARLITLRIFLVRKRAKLKQKARELLMINNLSIARCDIFGKKAQQEILALPLPDGFREMIEIVTRLANPLNEAIQTLGAHLKRISSSCAETQILRSIPGVGFVTAATMQAVVGNWSRFNTANHLASYAGLVPSARDSGKVVRRGRITKRGSRILRTALYEATIGANPSWGQLWNFFERIKEKKGTRQARVALARKMLTIAWHLVKKKECFSLQPLQNQNRPDLVYLLAQEAVRSSEAGL